MKALLFNQRPTESHLSSRQQAAYKAAWLAALFLSRNVESQLRLVERSDWLAPRAPPQACAPVRARAGYSRDRGGLGAQSCLHRRTGGRTYLHLLCTPGLTALSLPGLPACVCVRGTLVITGVWGRGPVCTEGPRAGLVRISPVALAWLHRHHRPCNFVSYHPPSAPAFPGGGLAAGSSRRLSWCQLDALSFYHAGRLHLLGVRLDELGSVTCLGSKQKPVLFKEKKIFFF